MANLPVLIVAAAVVGAVGNPFLTAASMVALVGSLAVSRVRDALWAW